MGYSFHRYSKALLRCINHGHQRRECRSRYTWCGSSRQEDFSVEQYEPVVAPFVPVRVIAGPGSGKTRVLVGRIVHILEQNVNDAENILAVSFTNKAAAEMKQRVLKKVPESLVSKIFFGTFHSFCYRMLKLYGGSRDWVVLDQEGCQRLMQGIVSATSSDAKEVQRMSRSLLSRIQRMKNTLGIVNLDDMGFDDLSIGCIRAYQDALRAQQAVDFDDLLVMCLAMLEKDDLVRSTIQRKFKHVLVDEFQDVNKVQYRLLQMLCPADSDTSHVFVVGDVDQSIYSWRGACVDLMQSDFQRDFAHSLTFRMKDNYRTRRSILDGAQELINLVQSSDRGIFNAVRDGREEDVSIHMYRDPMQESITMAEDIKQRLGRNSNQQIAILVRTHSQVRCIESALVSSNLPYRVVGGISFWKRSEILDIVSYVKIAMNSSDQMAFDRVINTPKRGIGPSALAKIKALADGLNSTPSEVVLSSTREALDSLLKHAGIGPKVCSSLQGFRDIVFNSRECLARMTLDEAIDQIIHLTSYGEYIESINDVSKRVDKLDNMHELLEQARGFRNVFAQDEQDEIPKRFIDHVAIHSQDEDENYSFPNGTLSGQYSPVTISTMHAAKGLEFDTVYVPGMNDGIVPLSPNNKDVDAWAHMEEETRLMFVAVTRAKDSLVLSYTQEPLTYGNARPGRRPQLSRSRFLSCFGKATYRDFSNDL